MEDEYEFDANDDENYENENYNGQNNDAQDVSAIIKEKNDLLDLEFGYEEFKEGDPKTGWLLNIIATAVENPSGPSEAAVELFFIEQSGNVFKGTFLYRPYFYVYAKPGKERSVLTYLERHYRDQLADIEIIRKLDMNKPNHLVADWTRYIKLVFHNVQDLLSVRKELMPVINRNKQNMSHDEEEDTLNVPVVSFLYDIREYDVPYVARVCIDNNIRIGSWFNVTCENDHILVSRLEDMIATSDPKVFAFDIECSKEPLKFPNAEFDSIYMISIMISGQGYLIINREFVSADIPDFDYTPKPEYPGPFKVFNETNEENSLRRFYKLIKDEKPHIFVTFNGDFFDWPFVRDRSNKYGINMEKEIGIREENDEFRGRCAVHLDAYAWVNRDSYLPQGSRGLKAVTKYKLGYDPIEIQAEDMQRYAMEDPFYMASYSVSDAVATYYLYMKYVHLFIYSLCTIIPLIAEDVLRKGSGTLCETLLMDKAYKEHIIFPNKDIDDSFKFYEGHLLETETYIGGTVECLQSGVYRYDLPTYFNLDPTAYTELINKIDEQLNFNIEVENGFKRHDITNYDEIRQQIISGLEALRDNPKRYEKPVIYHLDVGAMYPNIILTNRLQPCSIVNRDICSSCAYNKDSNNCKRVLQWKWRGEHYPLTSGEFKHIKNQLEEEYRVKNKEFDGKNKPEFRIELKSRVKDYCRKGYKRVKDIANEVRETTVCMREHPFYVDTVRDFRDRRYEYKKLTKKWNGNVKAAEKEGDNGKLQDAKMRSLLYDSLQLAHKCILNSFYGYVMRKGARWRSIEMAGATTTVGGGIITNARHLVERVGKPLELDTDGIWCILPSSFPQLFKFKTSSGSSFPVNYPCIMLNYTVHNNNTNHQFQNYNEERKVFTIQSECSIFFEPDGPYRAMVLPASTDEGRLLKKRYAVFNFDGSLAELKGFELKRRGELQIIKIFQSQVFEKFLEGDTLENCYKAVAEVADHWLDVLVTKGNTLEDDELIELISENKTMSRAVTDYGTQKSTSITTVRRLAEFLGEDMLLSSGVACSMIISKYPEGAPVTERAIPTNIFQTDEKIKKHFLRIWTKNSSLQDTNIRNILDWNYYFERFAGTVRKIITIPAGLQDISNPVPRVPHPDWVRNMINRKRDTRKQTKIDSLFTKLSGNDIEDLYTNTEVTPIDVSNTNSNTNNDVMEVEVTNSNIPPKEPTMSLMSLNTKQTYISRQDNIQEWLKQRKESWKENRKRSVSDVKGQAGRQQANIPHSLSSSFSSYWQILEIAVTSIPGELAVWLLNEKQQLLKISLTVQRTLYIASKQPLSLTNINKVNRITPTEEPAAYIYQIEANEKRYQSIIEDIWKYNIYSNIDTIYGTKIPSDFSAILALGCVCQPINKQRKMATSTSNIYQSIQLNYKLQDLTMLNTVNYDYLTPLSSRYRRFYLYVNIQDDNRGVIGLYINNSIVEDIDFTKPFPVYKCTHHIIELNAFASPYDETLPYKKYIKESFNENTSTVSDIHIYKVKTKNEAYQQLNSLLVDYNSSPHPATFIHIQSMFTSKLLRSYIPILEEFSIIPLQLNYYEMNVRLLSWRNELAKYYIQNCYTSFVLWKDRLEGSRYSHIPIANLQTDIAVNISDVLFSRLLQLNKHILWASYNSLPDFGGKEDNYHDDLNSVLECPVINNPGSYKCICFEIKIFNLTIDTIQQCQYLEKDDAVFIMDEEHCKSSFQVLQLFINKYLQSAITTKNKYADYLLMNVLRWLRSQSSMLYNPYLLSIVYRLMKQTFKNLLNELRRLDVTIIYANFDHIYISTNKYHVDEAEEYITYILDTIRSKDLFKYIQFSNQRIYSSLLWFDITNYSGFMTWHSEEISDEPIEGDCEYINCFILSELLPEKYRLLFTTTIADFMNTQQTYRNKLISEGRSVENIKQLETSYMLEYLHKNLTERLIIFVSELQGSIASAPQLKAPVNVNTLINNTQAIQTQNGNNSLSQNASSLYTNSILNLVKYICIILGLDTQYETSVAAIRRKLLKNIHVREFSSEAQFSDPFSSLVLKGVICTLCNDYKDIDVCKDHDKQLPVTEYPWVCSNCGTEYNMKYIETRLIEQLNNYIYTFNTQDLCCQKCERIKTDSLSQYCLCSGTYRYKTISSDDFIKQLNIYKCVAIYHHFDWLKDTVEHYLNY